MAISVGDTLPASTLAIMTDEGPGPFDLNAAAAGKKVVLIGVPGAFTPTCHGNHLPGYLDNLDALKEKGVDEVAVVSVNDPFVVEQWALASGGKGKIHFLADGAAHFTKSIGMEIDLSDFGMGIRSQRYSMVLDDGKVMMLNVEESPKDATATGAAKMLADL